MVIYFLWSLLRRGLQNYFLYVCIVLRYREERLFKVSIMRKWIYNRNSIKGMDEKSYLQVNNL